ncbi:DUF1465 family protein [Caenispirillum salinarum]|uniref:DUF1465 family protein n=1 Tax=Caenispirillum salinarum TaxID=859058 RepID=UPI00384F6AD9
MTKTMLENIYHDALTLMEEMRDYVREDARRDREALPWEDRAAIIQVNRLMTVRLCHALQLIQAHRARLAGDLEAGRPPRIGLAPVPVDRHGTLLPPRLLELCENANHLFDRLHAVHLAILPGEEMDGLDARDHTPIPPTGAPSVAALEVPETVAGDNSDEDERAYA